MVSRTQTLGGSSRDRPGAGSLDFEICLGQEVNTIAPYDVTQGTSPDMVP
jgi:hypothetical protein